MSEGQGHSHRIELRSLLRELSGFPEMHKQLTASDKLHDKENFLIGLEYVLHTYKEGVVGLLQDFFFKESRFYLVIINNYVLS